MILINQIKCNACGICTRICHENCMKINDNILSVNYKYCSTCTQCIAICPEKAISWDNHEPLDFDRSLYPGPGQVAELLMERRTIRDFANKRIERPLLEEITGFAIYAPTHDFNLKAVIIDDEQIISQIDNLILRFSIKVYRWLFRTAVIHSLIKIFTPSMEFEFLKTRPKLESAKKRNHGLKTKPAAVIMIVGDKRTPLSLESAQYALYNIDLYAQSRGLACRNLVGNQMILNRNKEFRKLMGLNKYERISGLIILGYPAIKFRNKVIGKKMSIQWNALKK